VINQDLNQLTAYVVVQSPEGKGVFLGDERIQPSLQAQSLPGAEATREVAATLEAQGLSVERVSRLAVRVTGSAAFFQNKFGLDFEKASVPEVDSPQEWPIETPYRPTPASMMKLLDTGLPQVEGLVFPQPIALHSPAANPPKPTYHHLTIPDGVIAGLNAGPVHAAGFHGQGVRAAMIDSGFAWDHPYFMSRGYDLDATVMAGGNTDRSGHGTGESANFLAIAPKAKLYGLPMSDIVAAFQTARDDLTVDLITNSWGSAWPTDGSGSYWDPYWELVEAEIALCVSSGIVVLFSGGNGGRSFTASMPDTISVGGVYKDQSGALQASDYASSFDSTRYPGSHVPEVCGLVGMKPRAIYITLPVPAECEIDQDLSGVPFPINDETAPDDGWAVFSGTSAACPMVAGVVALILSKYPNADLTSIRNRLYAATDVTVGKSAHGDSAGKGFDKATGFGLVDAARACL